MTRRAPAMMIHLVKRLPAWHGGRKLLSSSNKQNTRMKCFFATGMIFSSTSTSPNSGARMSDNVSGVSW